MTTSFNEGEHVVCRPVESAGLPPAPADEVPQAVESHHQPTWKRRLKRLSIFAVAVALLCGLGWWFRAPVLRELANAWVIDRPVQKADAAVVLGGGLDTRPFAAAKLFRKGWVPRILIMNVEVNRAAELGLVPTETATTRKVLESEGIPGDAIIEIGHGVTSTYDEAEALRQWALQFHPKSILVPTDLFHTRRVDWLLNKQLRDTGAVARVMAIKQKRYNTADWWQNEEGFLAFHDEVLKTIYYWWKY